MKRISYLLFAILMIATLALSACQPATTAAPTATAVPPTAVPPTEVPPTPEPTAVPLGTPDNPFILALAPSATTQELQAGGEAIAAKLTEMTGYTFKVNVPTNYAAMVEAMGAGNAHVGFMPPLAYMLAKYKGYADVGLVVLRNGSDHYGFQFVANVDRKDKDGNPMFTSYYDAATGKNTADAATALAQFAGKKPCYTDPLSASGYVIPAGVLGKNSVKTKAGAWVQGHGTVITSVYLSPNGEICDFGATFIDARTSVAKTFPDVNDKVQVLFVSDPIIPNDNVAFAANVPADAREKITKALLDLAGTEEGRALLKNGGYDIGGLAAVDDTFYDDFRAYLEAAKYDYTSYK